MLVFLAVAVACLVLGWQLNTQADDLEGLLSRAPTYENSSRLSDEELAQLRQGFHWSQILARARLVKAAAVGLVAVGSLSLVASLFCLWEERLRREAARTAVPPSQPSASQPPG